MGRCVTITSTQAASSHYLHMIRFQKKNACGCEKKISAMPSYQQPITTSPLEGFRTSKFLGWQESNLDLQGVEMNIRVWQMMALFGFFAHTHTHTNTPKNYLVGMFQEVQTEKCLWYTASYDQMPLFSRPEVGEGIRSATPLRFSEHWLTLNHVAALGLETMSWKVCHFHNSQSESQTHDGLQNFRQDSFGVQLLVSKW